MALPHRSNRFAIAPDDAIADEWRFGAVRWVAMLGRRQYLFRAAEHKSLRRAVSHHRFKHCRERIRRDAISRPKRHQWRALFLPRWATVIVPDQWRSMPRRHLGPREPPFRCSRLTPML